MVARIFKPSKSAMQSGMAQTKSWVMELEHSLAKTIDPLMGWTGTKEPNGQIQIKFPNEQAAIKFVTPDDALREILIPALNKICVVSNV